MGIPNQQIGWSQEAILLQRILKQIALLNRTISGIKPATTTTTTTV